MVVSNTFLCCVTIFCLSLPPVLYRRAHVLFTLSVFVFAWWCPTHFFVVLRCYVHLYLQFFIGGLMSYLSNTFLCCVTLFCSSTSSSVYEISCLIYVFCLCLRMVVSNIFLCCVTLFCSSTSSSVYEVSCLSFVICAWLRMVVSNTFLSYLPMVGGSIRDSGFFHH